MDLKPFIQLARLDRPIGIYLLLFPCLWSIGFASGTSFPVDIYLVFIIGSVLMRSAGCVINDIVDLNIDAKVKRTKNRPLASGKLTLLAALVFLALILLVALSLLFYLNKITIILGFFILFPIILYPFAKRFTYWPQAVLGVTFNFGAIMGYTAVVGEFSMTALCVYLSAVCWTLGYDTIYGHQDIEDDLRLGLKSTSIKFGKDTKKALTFFYSFMVVMLWFAGVISDVEILFHIFLLFATLVLAWQIVTLDIFSPANCLARFKSNQYVGLIIFFGIITGQFL